MKGVLTVIAIALGVTLVFVIFDGVQALQMIVTEMMR